MHMLKFTRQTVLVSLSSLRSTTVPFFFFLPDMSWTAPCRWQWKRRGQWPGRSDSRSPGQSWSGWRKTDRLRPLHTPCSSYSSGHCGNKSRKNEPSMHCSTWMRTAEGQKSVRIVIVHDIFSSCDTFIDPCWLVALCSFIFILFHTEAHSKVKLSFMGNLQVSPYHP